MAAKFAKTKAVSELRRTSFSHILVTSPRGLKLQNQEKSIDANQIYDGSQDAITNKSLVKSQNSHSIQLRRESELLEGPKDSNSPNNNQDQQANKANIVNELKEPEKKLDDVYEDDGVSYSISSSSDSSIDSAKKEKLKEIVDRLVGIDNRLQERVKFEEMISDNLSEESDDETPDLKEAIFFIPQYKFKDAVRCRKGEADDKIVIYDFRSLYIFYHNNWIRKNLVQLIESQPYDTVVLISILVSTVNLLIYDYSDPKSQGQFNKKIDQISAGLIYFYILEFVMKIVAMGGFMHYNSYFRSAWNWLDFLVVIVGIFEVSPLPDINIQSIRALRVIRPLKTIKQYPSMRKLVSGLLGSIKSLGNVLLFMFFIFLQFAIFGTQQFGGSYYNRCRITSKPINGSWPYDTTINRLCSQIGGGYSCPSDEFCRTPQQGHLSLDIDSVQDQSLIDYGITNFDNVLWSMVTIFQCVTLEGWSTIMYNLMDANKYGIVMVFFVSLIIIGSYFLLNVILAVLADSLDKSEDLSQKDTLKHQNAIAKSIKRVRRQSTIVQIEKLNSNLQRARSFSEHKVQLSVSRSQRRSILQLMKAQQPQKSLTMPLSQLNLVGKRISMPNDKPHFVKNSISMPLGEQNSLEKDSNVLFQNQNQNQLDHSNITQAQMVTANQVQETVLENNFVSQNDLESLSKLQQNYESQLSEIPFQSIVENKNEQLTEFDEYQGRELTRLKTKKFIPYEIKHNKIRYFCFLIVGSPLFLLLITVLIISNTIVLGMDRYPITAKNSQLLDLLNQVFSWFFFVEMILKLTGLGFNDYIRDQFNIFDALIVVLSLVEQVLQYAQTKSLNVGPTMLGFRAIRLLRIFKLARSWKSFKVLLKKIANASKEMSTFAVLLIIFEIVAVIIGLQFFSFTTFIDQNDKLSSASFGNSPQQNFDTVYNAFVTVFVILFGNNWNSTMYPFYRSQGYIAIVYFILTTVITNIILLNMFLALLLASFQKEQTNDNDSDLTGFQQLKLRVKTFFLGLKTKASQVSVNLRMSSNLQSLSSESFSKQATIDQSQIIHDNIVSRLNTQQKLVASLAIQRGNRVFDIRDIDKKTLDERKQLASISHISKTDLEIKEVNNEVKKFQLQGTSLFLFGPTNIVRRVCNFIISHKYFDPIVIMVILISVVSMVLDNPLADPNTLKATRLVQLDIFLSVFFTFESLLKVITLGFF